MDLGGWNHRLGHLDDNYSLRKQSEMTGTTAAGQLIDLHDIGTNDQPKPKLLIKTEPMNVMRLVLTAGKAIPEHKAAKDITVQCVAGKVEFTTMGETHTMTPGTMLFLPPEELHSLNAIEDSIMVVTKPN
ncbi:cupin domain-containing protein [Stieleria marina]|uniref:AraC-like ligand binding domain protein n=1 Tax=Stieleria marina TaxID=1930275 RepID=A0A517NR84_9BACT|nr:AraC-like ligand binding domain protein [Planctomycetes bacterium K23_9]